MKKFISLIPLIFPFANLSCSSQNSLWISRVQFVHDGDTLTVDNQKIRLFGVDTPELNNQYAEFQPTTGIERIYGLQALEYTRNFTKGKEILITKMTIDPYKRIVAKINSGKDLGEELIRVGLARVAFISLNKRNPFYTIDTSYYKKLLDAQYEAYNKNVGIWAHKDLFKIIFPKA